MNGTCSSSAFVELSEMVMERENGLFMCDIVLVCWVYFRREPTDEHGMTECNVPSPSLSYYEQIVHIEVNMCSPPCNIPYRM